MNLHRISKDLISELPRRLVGGGLPAKGRSNILGIQKLPLLAITAGVAAANTPMQTPRPTQGATPSLLEREPRTGWRPYGAAAGEVYPAAPGRFYWAEMRFIRMAIVAIMRSCQVGPDYLVV